MTFPDNHTSRSGRVPLGALLETGTVPLDSPLYVERDSDLAAAAHLRSGKATVVIKGYRQSGKSSFLLRLHALGIQQNWRSCYLNLQALDFHSISDTDTLFRQLAWMMVDELDSNVDPMDYWSMERDSISNFTLFVENAVLAQSESAVQILFDEADIVFQPDSSRTDFFSMIRSWHNLGAFDTEWQKLRLVLSHSTDPALWISDLQMSPFNVGFSLTLADFDLLQISDLNRRYGEPLQNDTDIRRLAQLIGGHPFLVRLALWTLVEKQWRMDELEATAKREEGPFASHLDAYGSQIDENPELAQALRQVIQNGTCDERSFRKLWSIGLVRRAERRSVTMRCRLYHDYFVKRL